MKDIRKMQRQGCKLKEESSWEENYGNGSSLLGEEECNGANLRQHLTVVSGRPLLLPLGTQGRGLSLFSICHLLVRDGKAKGLRRASALE